MTATQELPLSTETNTAGAGRAYAEAGLRTGPTRGRGPAHTAIYVLVLLTAGAYIPTPLYPGYQHVFGFSDLTLAVVYAAFAVVSAPALLVFGSAHDMHGARPVLQIGVIFAFIGSACLLLAVAPAMLIVARVAQGVALGAVTAAATALIVSAAAPGGAKRASLIASVAFVAGTGIGPLVSGALASFVPGPFAVIYLVHLALLAYAWYRVVKLPARKAHGARWRPTWPSVPPGIRTVFATSATTGFLAWTAAGIFLALGPSLIANHGTFAQHATESPAPADSSPMAHLFSTMAMSHGLHSRLPMAAAAVIAVLLSCSIVAQLLSARLRAQTAQALGACALAAALALLGLLGNAGSLTAFLVASAVAGFGHGFAYYGAAATVNAVTPEAERGGVTASLYLAFYLGTGIPTIAVGVITLRFPLTTAVSALAWAGTVLSVLVVVAVAYRACSGRSRRAPGRLISRRRRTRSQVHGGRATLAVIHADIGRAPDAANYHDTPRPTRPDPWC